MATTAAAALTNMSLAGAKPGLRAPLTERAMARLPGPRLVWLLAWGLSPFAALEIVHAIEPLPFYQGFVPSLAFGLFNLFGLWAAGRLAGRVKQLEPTLERLLPADELDPRRHPFRHLGSVVGPVVISAVMVLTWEFVDFLARPSPATGLLVGIIFIAQLGATTFLWVYFVSLIGLDRTGRRPLRLPAFATDPSLGLRGLGSLAFEAFLLAGAVIVPIFLGVSDPRAFIGALLVLLIVGALFFLSVRTLHRRLAEAKTGHVRWARQLVTAALRPMDQIGSERMDESRLNAALDDVTSRLSAAVEIERRALAIQDWPFDAAILRTVVAILTSATAIIAARLLLSRFEM